MDTTQTALIGDVEALWTRILRMMDDLASGSYRALMRDMRAFEARVRLWLIGLALTMPAAPMRAKRKSSLRGPQAPRKSKRQRPPRLGLRLFTTAPSERAPKSNTASISSPQTKRAARDEGLRFVLLAELFHRLEDIRNTLADPSHALARLGRKRPADPPPDPMSANLANVEWPVRDPETGTVLLDDRGNWIFRRADLPRPDS